MSERLLTKREAARYFAVSTRTLERWVGRGLLARVVVGSVVRFRAGDAEMLVRKNLRGGFGTLSPGGGQ